MQMGELWGALLEQSPVFPRELILIKRIKNGRRRGMRDGGFARK
jgi:hypothetical protein